MKPVIIGCPEVKPQSELGGQELPERDIGESKVFLHHCHLGVTRRIDALVLVIFPLQGLPEIAVTVEDVTIVVGHHLVAGDLDYGLLHDGAAQVLNHGPVCIFTI